MQSEPCHVNTTADLLEDLWRRLSATRWPDELDGAGRDYGSPVDYWLNDFDWREQESLINSFSHYKATVGGLGLSKGIPIPWIRRGE